MTENDNLQQTDKYTETTSAFVKHFNDYAKKIHKRTTKNNL